MCHEVNSKHTLVKQTLAEKYYFSCAWRMILCVQTCMKTSTGKFWWVEQESDRWETNYLYIREIFAQHDVSFQLQERNIKNSLRGFPGAPGQRSGSEVSEALFGTTWLLRELWPTADCPDQWSISLLTEMLNNRVTSQSNQSCIWTYIWSRYHLLRVNVQQSCIALELWTSQTVTITNDQVQTPTEREAPQAHTVHESLTSSFLLFFFFSSFLFWGLFSSRFS